MPSYPAKAAKALGFLRRYRNDVEVFVEDTGNPRMWTTIIKGLLPQGTRFTGANMLGGRSKVVAACRADQSADGRRKLYIIDGDFDILRRKRKPRLRYLVRLRAYCVENLLCARASIMSVAADASPHLTDSQITTILNQSPLLSGISISLTRLFVLYGSVFAETPQIATVSRSVSDLFTNTASGPVIDSSKVLALRKQILKEVAAMGKIAQLRKRHLQYLRNLRSARVAWNIVSGKDYIFPLVHIVLKSGFGYRGTPEQLKARLALSFDGAADPALVRAISTL